MKKLILFTLALSLFFLYSSAQTWQHILSSPNGGIGGSNSYGIRVIDDTVFVSSLFVMQFVPLENPDTTIYRERAVISKHDLDTGEMLDYQAYWDQESDRSYFNEVRVGYDQLYNTNDNLIYISRANKTDGASPQNDCDYLIVDKSLNIVYESPIEGFPDDQLMIYNNSRIDDNGYVYLFGQRAEEEGVEEVGGNNTLLTKISPEGEQLWVKRYDDSYTIQSLLLHSDGSIYLTAGRSNGALYYRKLLIKADSNGEEIWRHNYGGFAMSAYSYLLEDTNGNIIIAGDWNGDYIDADSWYEKWLQVMHVQNSDFAFELIEEYKYAYSISGTYTFGIDHTSDGGYISWGRRWYNEPVEDFNPEEAPPGEKAFLIKLDANLDSIWMRHYWQYSDDPSQFYHKYLFSDVTEIEGGGYVGTGRARRVIPGQGYREDAWICRLDEYGCLEPGCQLVNVEEIVIGLENTMSVFPNPVSDICTIEFDLQNSNNLQDILQKAELSIFDMQGKEVMHINLAQQLNGNQIQFSVNHLSSGTYLAHLTSEGKWLDSVKLVVGE